MIIQKNQDTISTIDEIDSIYSINEEIQNLSIIAKLKVLAKVKNSNWAQGKKAALKQSNFANVNFSK